MTTELVFVRHGETASNTRGLLHGRTDVPLNANGRQQAVRVAERIAAMEHIAAVHSSPLCRARATAEEICRRLGLEPTDHPDLSEIDFGAIEGLGFAEFADRHPDLFQRLQDPSDPGAAFPGGESLPGFHARVRRSIERLARAHPAERIVVVAHGGVIASSVAQLIGAGPADWSRYMVRNCSVTQLAWDGGRATLESWDDVSHLDVPLGLAR